MKGKAKVYTIYCGRMICKDCCDEVGGNIKICQYKGTKKQVKAHIKKYWKQPKIKEVSNG